MFADLFRSENKDWTLDDAPGFLTLPGGKLIFPDFAFHSRNDRTVYLELFHRWHASQLDARLSECNGGRLPQPLLLGVDRSLLKKDGLLAARLNDDEYFQSHGFLFRDFPGVKNISVLLDTLA